MEVFRISKEKHSKKIVSSGAANRWNYMGQFVVYTSESRSLSTLELVVQRKAIIQGVVYKVMLITVEDKSKLFKEVIAEDLPPNWWDFSKYSKLQKIGSSWYENQDSLVLSVPSAIIPQERNYIINTRHPEFERCVKLLRIEGTN